MLTIVEFFCTSIERTAKNIQNSSILPMKSFLSYYHEELLFLRQKGGDFAKKHPEIAGRLDIKNGESTDPQTERIIESVAFLSAKLSQKIDDNAQNIAFHLLSALYPNLINVFPPCSIVQFASENLTSIANNVTIDRDTDLFVKTSNGTECQFKTLYPITIYPFSIAEINLLKVARKLGGDDGWCLEIKISTNSAPIEHIQPNDILFYIDSNILENSLMIYESIFSNPNRSVFLKIGERHISIDPNNVIPCGFDDVDSVCPVSPYSTNCFQLFQEVLHFKRKFMFFRILNIGKTIIENHIENIDELSIIIDINVSNERLLQIVNRDSIKLNAVPIVNLFQVTSDPFRFDGTQSKYMLLADQAKDESIEIHSISELHIINNETKEDEIVQPYFSLEVDSDTNITHDLYWIHSKEPSAARRLNGFDTYISFVDTRLDPHKVYSDVVYAKTLCTNRYATRDIPVFSKFFIDNAKTAGYYAKLLHKTTEPVSFADEATTLWNLISQLSANHMTMSKSDNILAATRKIADIFSSGNRMKVEELFSGIKSAKVNDTVQRFGNDAWRGFVKGKKVILEVSDENSFFSYLLGSIINQYLSDLVSINSFITLKMVSTVTNKNVATWNPTSGRKELV